MQKLWGIGNSWSGGEGKKEKHSLTGSCCDGFSVRVDKSITLNHSEPISQFFYPLKASKIHTHGFLKFLEGRKLGHELKMSSCAL